MSLTGHWGMPRSFLEGRHGVHGESRCKPQSAETTVIRLMRHYAAARTCSRQDPLATFVARGRAAGLSGVGSVALASLFELTEAVIGRRLVAGGDGLSRLTDDERAILRLLNADLPVTPVSRTLDVPHGLPGALTWAVISVRHLCHGLPDRPAPLPGGETMCPFAYASPGGLSLVSLS